MATGPPVCLPSHSPNTPGTTSQATKGGGPSGSSLLATPTVVLHDPKAGHSAPTSSTSPTRPPPSGSNMSSRAAQTTTDRLEIEWAHLVALGLSEAVVTTMLASRRQSTTRIYGYTWRAFSRWCVVRARDPLAASVEIILEFLQDGLKKGLRPATLRRQVEARDSIHSLRATSPFESLSRHPLIQKFLRGSCSLNPGTTHRFPSWKLHTMLRALMGPPFEPMSTTDLKWVKQKTFFLVAITSVHRVSELGALSCRSYLCVFHYDKVVLRPDPRFTPKIASRFHRDLEISLPSCPRPTHSQECHWHTLDV